MLRSERAQMDDTKKLKANSRFGTGDFASNSLKIMFSVQMYQSKSTKNFCVQKEYNRVFTSQQDVHSRAQRTQ